MAKIIITHQAQQARDTNLPKPLRVSPQQEPVESELVHFFGGNENHVSCSRYIIAVTQIGTLKGQTIWTSKYPQTIENHIANCHFLDTRAKPPRTMKSVWKAPATARGTAMRALWRCFAMHIYTDHVYAKGTCESTKWKHLLSEDPFMSFQFKKAKKITGDFE